MTVLSSDFKFNIKNEGNLMEIAELYMKFFSHMKYEEKMKEIKENIDKKKFIVNLFIYMLNLYKRNIYVVSLSL